MKPNAIVYTSNTGYTAEYASLLGRETGLPVYSLEKALKNVALGTEVIYLGWLMASFIRGYDKAAKRFKICAVCGVGTGENGSQHPEVRKNNKISGDVPLFTLRGGLDMNKLKGLYKFMMNIVVKKLADDLYQKEQRTAEEEVTLGLLVHGGNCVSAENLAPVIDWYKNE